MPKQILIVSNEILSLINFRSSLIEYLITSGYRVTVLIPKEKYNFENKLKKLRNKGVEFKLYSLSRTGLNPFFDLFSYISIKKVISEIAPDIVIAYTAKPVIYTGIAVSNLSKIKYYPMITGLGYGFTYGTGIKRKLIKKLMIYLYKKGLKNSKGIIFQNSDDKNEFSKLKIIGANNSKYIVNGSGVDLNVYSFSRPPKKHIFLMLSRLLIDKGIREYAEAARIVKSFYPNVIFRLAGRLDENPSCIKSNELKFWIAKGYIEYLGEISSVHKSLSSCRYYVLPSYREGTPRSVLEALATGRPVITTDVPGCRETVIHEKNGLLVPPKNSQSLANAMINLIEKSDEEIYNMGIESFNLSKNKYDVVKINKNILKIINL